MGIDKMRQSGSLRAQGCTGIGLQVAENTYRGVGKAHTFVIMNKGNRSAKIMGKSGSLRPRSTTEL